MNIRSVPEQVLRFNHPTSILDSSSHTRSEIAHKVIAWKKNKGQMKFEYLKLKISWELLVALNKDIVAQGAFSPFPFSSFAFGMDCF